MCRDVIEAELSACKAGLTTALQRNNIAIQIEPGSKSVVKMINSKEVDRSIYAHLVFEIKQLIGSCNSCISFGNISQNKASASLVNYAMSSSRTMTWLGAGPPEVLGIASDDCNTPVIE